MIGLTLEIPGSFHRQPTLASWQPAPAPFPATAVYDFAAGLQSWAKSSANGLVTLDLTVKDTGKTQSLKLQTQPAATTVDAHITGLDPNKDLSGKVIRLRLAVDQLARLGYARLAFLNDGNANYSSVDLLTNASGISDNGEWVTVEIVKNDLEDQAINLASIDRIMIRHSALAAANVVQANVQSIALRDQPAAGCVVLAFDDGWKGQYQNAFPIMRAAGLPGCAYVICDQHEAGGGALYMNRAELHALQNAGWDIGCHADTIAHHNAAAGFTALDAASFEAACVVMKRWHIVNGFRSDHFAWPVGKHTLAHRTIAARYFSSQRTYRTNLNRFEADLYPFADATRLRQCGVTGGASPSPASAITALIDTCMLAKKTLILTFHNIGNGGGNSEYPVASFAEVIGHIATKAYPVKTLTRIFARGV